MTEVDWNTATSVFSLLLFSDILKKFNPQIKGMSMGKNGKQSGFNVAVKGAKISWVYWFVIRFSELPLKCFVDSWLSLILDRGIPGQVRRLVDILKNDSVSSTCSNSCTGFTFQEMHKRNKWLIFVPPLSLWFSLHPFNANSQWISTMTGSWWPSSSEAMTCVSTATTGWAALRSRPRKCRTSG